MALDQREPEITGLEQLRAERDRIRGRLGHGPPDPRSSTANSPKPWRGNVTGATTRGGDSTTRVLDPSTISAPSAASPTAPNADELEDRIDNFTDEIDSSNQQVADAEQRLSTIEPTVLTRERWEAHHGTELARLDTLNRQIEVTERLDRVGNRTPERGVDRDFDIGM